MTDYLFGPLISALNALRDAENRPAAQRRRFFAEHIEPAQRRMEEIHKDYTRAFLTAAEGLRQQKSLEEVVAILRAERPIVLAQRTEVKVFLKELLRQRVRYRPIKSGALFVLFYSYVQAVESYLSAASPLPQGATWYSYFIDTFAHLVASGNDPFAFHEYAISGHERDAPNQALKLLETSGLGALGSNLIETARPTGVALTTWTGDGPTSPGQLSTPIEIGKRWSDWLRQSSRFLRCTTAE
jgi:hypothetical protein